jgi:integrase
LPNQEPAPQTFSTKADAARWLATVETDLLRGTLHMRTTSELTLGEWLEQWQKEHSLHKRPGTLARERSAIKRHITPALGETALEALRPIDLQRFVAEVATRVGAGTTHSIYAVLRAALNDAAKLELIARSPARGIKLPIIQRTQITTLRPSDLAVLAGRLEEPWRPMVYVAGTCGLRYAEIAGLRWQRVDIEARTLHVIETAPQLGGDRAEPKSRAGRRNVPMTSLVAEMLVEHRRRVGGGGDDLVFRARHGGRMYAPNWHRYVWAPAREAAGWPTLRFHDLRHSAVPLWISMGANLLQVSRWLGHSSVQITADVYGHLFPETNDLVISRLDRALRESIPAVDKRRARKGHESDAHHA